MKHNDIMVRKLVHLLNIPSYELELNLVPHSEDDITCPGEVESLIARLFRTLDLESLHSEGILCHVLLPMKLHELLVPMESNYLLLGPFFLEAVENGEFEVMLSSRGLSTDLNTMEYFQSLSSMSSSRFDELSSLFSELLGTDVRTIGFEEEKGGGKSMERILFSASEEETGEKAVELYSSCVRALVLRDMAALGTSAEKWTLFISSQPRSAFPFLKEMVWNEYILMCSVYHETVQYRATVFISYLRRKLDACSENGELVSFHRGMIEAFSSRLDSDEDSSLPPAVRKTRRYIRSHYGENLKLSVLADNAGLSTYYLSSLFQKSSGGSITDYILSVRTKQAERYLLYSDLSVSDIAGLCGFSDAGYFTKRFRKATGMTPESYRLSEGH